MRFEHRKQRRCDVGHAGFGIAPRAGLRDRAFAKLRSHTLDVALADGLAPESDPAIALRARRLIDPLERRSIADTLRGIVREAREGPRSSRVRVPAVWRRVAEAGEELAELADALSTPGPVAAHGVAEALLLLTDGSGPVYNPDNHASLRLLAAQATADLRL